MRALLLVFLLTWACAPASASEDRRALDLPAQSLDLSLFEVSRILGLQLIFTDGAVGTLRAPPLRGRFTARQALSRLLSGSVYSYRFTNANTVRIFRKDRTSRAARTNRFRPARPSIGVSGNDPLVGAHQDGARRPADPVIAEKEIVVTGSRVRRDTVDTPSPIITVLGEELGDRGLQDLSESLAELPFVRQSTGATSDGGNAQSEGLSTIDLRALGDNRTLVLIDGRRAVSNSAQANRVSLGSIPNAFIDRIDIITGGASSVYGSDAIAGVVNIITESERTGFRISALGGIAEAGADERVEATGSWGARFDENRGYFLISGTYEKAQGIKATDRAFALVEADFNYNTMLGINEFNGIVSNGGPGSDLPASTFPPNLLRDRSTTFFPGGLFDANVAGNDPIGFFDVGGSFLFLGRDVTANDVADRFGATDRVFNNILNPQTRYLGAAKFDYALSDKTTIFAQIQFAREQARSQRRPQSFNDSTDYSFFNEDSGLFEFDSGVGTIDRDDPLVVLFAPPELKTTDGTRGLGSIDWDRRFDELGPTITENERTTVRSWLGIRGQAWDDWRWEATIGYGDFIQKQLRRNEINLRALEQGLRTEFVDRARSNEIRCQSAIARSEGCVPVNIFGLGSISPSAAEYIRADLMLEAKIQQQTFQGLLNGSLLRLPAGELGASLGIEYRKDRLSLRNDALSQLGGTTEITVPDTVGSIGAFEGFAEITVPVLADQPFAERLDIDLSARIANYDIDTVGTVFTYRGGISWKLIEGLHLRAQYARAERAPDLTELFSPARGDTDSGIVDPCDGVDASTPGNLGRNCRADPGIATAIASGGIFESQPGTLLSTNEGNIALESEKSSSFTAGVVLSPRRIPEFSLSVDYYRIDIDNIIELFDNNLLLSNCFENDLQTDRNAFCSRIARDADTGEIIQIRQFETNSDKLSTSGLDFAAQYRFDLRSINLPGRIDFRANATHVLSRNITRLGVATDTRGSLVDANAYKWRALGSITWRSGPLRLRYQVEFSGPILDSRARLIEFRDVQARIPTAERPLLLRYPAVWEHSVSGSYQVNLGFGELRVSAGVNNILDRISPFAPDGDVATGRRANFNGNYDIRGRRVFLGAQVTF